MLLNEVLFDLNDEIKTTGAKLNIGNIGTATVIPFQFRQLLYNIVGNALKFKSKHRPLQIDISNSIETGAVIGLSKLNPDAEYYHITIADNGIGFEPQYSDKIFKVFQRLHDRTHFEGTGIGLAIVKKIVDNHHGLIKATGKLDQGATFEIYIPVV
jgi:light-regulated signal transduction histidine kinase (bacteriophytochrome)